MVRLRNAIVCAPASSMTLGITTRDVGPPDVERALAQHARYCKALERCALQVTSLPPDPSFPDSTFVEDTAVLAERCAVVTHPGAESRRGEIAAIRDGLRRFFPALEAISAPGTLDGGDVCRVGDRFIIGISARTNEEGARQLGGFLERAGYSWTPVDIRGIEGLLHLKSGMAALDDDRLLLIDGLAERSELAAHRVVGVEPREWRAANCVRVNQHLLLPRGYPATERALRRMGFSLVVLDVSEFEKMDGGLSCLSLRF